MKRAFLLLVASALISGCFSSDIETIKKGRLDGYADYTIGQAFENRKICSSTQWSEFKDSRERNIVRYQCELKGVREFLVSSLISNRRDDLSLKADYTARKMTVILTKKLSDLTDYQLARRVSIAEAMIKAMDGQGGSTSEISRELEKELSRARDFSNKIQKVPGNTDQYIGDDAVLMDEYPAIFGGYVEICNDFFELKLNDEFYNSELESIADMEIGCGSVLSRSAESLVYMLETMNRHKGSRYSLENALGDWKKSQEYRANKNFYYGPYGDQEKIDFDKWAVGVLDAYNSAISDLEFYRSEESSAFEYVDFVMLDGGKFKVVGSGVSILLPGSDAYEDRPYGTATASISRIYSNSASNLLEY